MKVIEAVKFDLPDFEMAKWIIERHIWERSAGGFYLSRKVESLTQILLWKAGEQVFIVADFKFAV